MSEREENQKKKKKKQQQQKALAADVLSWRQKKSLADAEEASLRREVEELISWTSLIEAMDDQQLKEYVLNRPESLKSTVKTGKVAPIKNVRKSGKPKCSSSAQGLMAAVWKFHREDEEEASVTC